MAETGVAATMAAPDSEHSSAQSCREVEVGGEHAPDGRAGAERVGRTAKFVCQYCDTEPESRIGGPRIGAGSLELLGGVYEVAIAHNVVPAEHAGRLVAAQLHRDVFRDSGSHGVQANGSGLKIDLSPLERQDFTWNPPAGDTGERHHRAERFRQMPD
ncbi:MAG: hypothetical protein H6R12_2625, partial [Proteobacteria bacterium]|nr:hypothetical protein [Pseudomonadota bacterium]